MNELKTIRKNIGLTQEEAAKMVGVSRRTYQTYEEERVFNDTYSKILNTLKDIQESKCDNVILSFDFIKKKSGEVFSKYKEVKCVYLYGSYSRGEATLESDVDFLVVCDVMGMEYYGMANELMNTLGKKVDLHTHRQIGDDEFFFKQILMDGIKIYVQKPFKK